MSQNQLKEKSGLDQPRGIFREDLTGQLEPDR